MGVDPGNLGATATATATATVRFEPPLDLAASLDGFRRWGDDLIDRWDGTTLRRTLPLRGRAVAVACRVTGTVAEPRVEVTVDEPGVLGDATAAVAGMVVTAATALEDLRAHDPVVDALEREHPGVRPVLQPDLLTAVVRSISAQQVNLRWAATTRRRLAEAFGTRHRVAGEDVYALEAGRLAAVDPAAIRALQFTTRKAEYIVGAARAVAEGRLDLERLRALPDPEVVAELVRLPGIGVWTAEWLLARTLGRPRVVAGDLGVRKAVGRAYLRGAMPDEGAVRRATAHWGEAAGVAQQLLLHALAHDAEARLITGPAATSPEAAASPGATPAGAASPARRRRTPAG